MNIYCPHCGKKNSYGLKVCASCSGDLNSLGAVRPTVQQQTFAPVIINTPNAEADALPGTKSAYLAKRAARKSGEERSPSLPGEPVIVQDSDEDGDSVQHFDGSKFSGVLKFTADSTQEDARKERISFQLPAPVQDTKPKRGRKPGSKNKK